MIVHDDPLCTLYHGDCVEVMRELPADSVDAIVTDPPYGLEFMGKEWDRLTTPIDSQVGSDDSVSVVTRTNHRAPVAPPAVRGDVRQPGDPTFHKSGSGPHDRSTVRYGYGVPMARMQAWHEAWAREAFRVAKPGAHLLAFGGTRTVHRLASAIEDAGWEIRDMLVWGYGSGFPKSSRVNRDPRFCQCDATARNGESTDLGPAMDDRTRTAEPSALAEGGARNGGNGTHAVPDSQERYWHDHGLGDVPPPQVEAIAPASPPSPADALARSRSAEPVDGEEPGPSRSPSQAQRNARPSNLGSALPRTASVAAGSDTPASTRPIPSTDSDSGTRAPRTVRKGESLSAWPHCTTCGKPDANGYGSALKPAFEPIVMARKPLRGTIADTVHQYGTGALNIDATRIGWRDPLDAAAAAVGYAKSMAAGRTDAGTSLPATYDKPPYEPDKMSGRWPANLILTDPIFDGDTPGVVGGGTTTPLPEKGYHPGPWTERALFPLGSGETEYHDSGTYSRFFLIPKAARSDREPLVRGEAVDYEHSGPRGHELNGDGSPRPRPRPRENGHPTVKPLDLMRHLVRLVTPPGGTVLDCFLGSGTTAIAANAEGFRCIGIEREREYLDIALARMAHQPLGLGLDVAAESKPRSKSRGHWPKDRTPGKDGWGFSGQTGLEERVDRRDAFLQEDEIAGESEPLDLDYSGADGPPLPAIDGDWERV